MADRDEWRVEVELGEPTGGLSLSERMRAHRLDDRARELLADRVVVTHDGPRLFVYAGDEAAAREAESVIGRLLGDERLDGRLAVTRWHPVEEAWKDAGEPLPSSEEEVAAEHERKVAAETREAVEEGEFDWEVRVELDSHGATSELAARLEAEGLPVTRRWRYLIVGALTEEGARELARRVVAEAPGRAEARIEARLDEPTHPLFVFFPGR